MARKKQLLGDLDARRGHWLKGVLDLCVLGLIGGDATYGYELATRFEQAGFGKVKGAALYPRLAAMEDEGLLVSEWRAGDGGPGRKYYTVSDAGRALLAAGGGEWHRFVEAVATLVPSPHDATDTTDDRFKERTRS